MKKIPQTRLNHFRQEIRRAHIDKIKQDFRKYSELDLTTNNQVAQLFKLPPKPESQKYSLDEILQKRGQVIVKPPLSPSAIQVQANEQIAPIEAHIKFWKLYSEQLQINEQAWSEQVISIIQFIMTELSYRQIHYNTTYQLHFLNTIELICPKMNKKDKDNVLEWISGPEGLRVIEACLDEQFLTYNHYGKVYQVIQIGLKSQLKSESIEAAKILNKIMYYADYDDAYTLYQKAHGLMAYLCKKIQRYADKQQTSIFNLAVMYLIDCYQDTVLDYARTGVAYATGLLITSNVDINRSEGMQLLRMLTEVNDVKMVRFLLENRDVEQTKLWEKFCQTTELCKCSNTTIRKNYFSILQNLFAHSQKNQIEQFCSKFECRYQDIFEMIADSIQNEDEPFILLRIMGCLNSLLYYGHQQNEQNILLPLLQARNLLRLIQKMSKHQNDDVSNKAYQLLKQLNQLKEQEKQI